MNKSDSERDLDNVKRVKVDEIRKITEEGLNRIKEENRDLVYRTMIDGIAEVANRGKRTYVYFTVNCRCEEDDLECDCHELHVEGAVSILRSDGFKVEYDRCNEYIAVTIMW